ncbi:cupin domain-containing protein [Desulfocucumis palustris]|nr:cupin domain-containing protein [Desulfocucumis palustris]
MKDFPKFMKNIRNRIKQSSQYTKDIEGYVFDGVDGSQMAIWTCHHDRNSSEHVHDFEEYIVCVYGQYIIAMNDNEITLNPGNELYIPSGTAHSGRCIAGTRTIHAFGAKRAEREG